MPKRRIGEILVRQGALTPDQLERALAIQREEKLMLGEVLTRMGVVRQVDVGKALAEQLGVPFVALEDQQVDAQAAILLPEMFDNKEYRYETTMSLGRHVAPALLDAYDELLSEAY